MLSLCLGSIFCCSPNRDNTAILLREIKNKIHSNIRTKVNEAMTEVTEVLITHRWGKPSQHDRKLHDR